jgi:NADH-quinone oxidoreductase subunit L
MFRLYFMTFTGAPRDHHRFDHAHESPASMTAPLAILAVPSVLLGFVPFGTFVYRGELEHAGIDLAVAVPASLAGFAGIGLAWLFYGRASAAPGRIAASLGGLYRATYSKFYVDEVYQFVTHKVVFALVSAPLAWFDRRIVDGTMDLTAQVTQLGGTWLRRASSGRLQTYLAWVAGGAAVLMLLLLAAGRPLADALAAAGYAAVALTTLRQVAQLLTGAAEPLKKAPRD